ncbi:glucosyltransferase [Ascosphaera aggregata]|nr:glucosyltransferase [Ascosphaera aggregata]
MMGVIVHFNTIIHPFTLADNRHYVFYVFRILLQHPLIKYAVTPLYCLCAWASISTLSGAWVTNSRTKSKRTGDDSNQERKSMDDTVRVSLVVIWLAATTLTLVTAPLVEPRYFIIPWVIWRLHVPPPPIEERTIKARILRNAPLLLESVWYMVINIVVGYMFLYRGFQWPQEPGVVQRFMW